MEQNTFHHFLIEKFKKALQEKNEKWHLFRMGVLDKAAFGGGVWEKEVKQHGYYVVQEKKFFAAEDKISMNFHGNIPISLAPHKHNFFELIYVYQGSITNLVDGKQVAMQEGDLCLLNANALHRMSPIEGDAVVINILITKNLMEHAFFCMPDDNDVIFRFFADYLYQKQQEKNYMLFESEIYTNSDYKQMVHKIILEFLQKKNNYGKAIEMALTSLFFELTREYRNQQNQKSEKELKDAKINITQMIYYIGENYQTATVSSTARHFNYHPNYLSLLLKKYVGKSFSEILQTFRLNMAKDYLRQTTMPIEQIVTSIGYSNKSYFYRIFKQDTGVSPSEYRKQSQNKGHF